MTRVKSMDVLVRERTLALSDSEGNYRSLVEGSPDAIYVHREANFIYANPAGLKLLGAERPEQLIGRPVWDFVPSDDALEPLRVFLSPSAGRLCSPQMNHSKTASIIALACLALTSRLLGASTEPAQRPPSHAVLWADNALSKVMRAATSPEETNRTLFLRGARGEIVSGQAVFRPEKAVTKIQATITELKHRVSGATLPSNSIRLQWVRYIDITRNSEIPPDELVAQAPAGIRQIHLHSVGRRTADILDPVSRVEANEPNLRRLAAWEKVIQRRGWQRKFVTSIVDEPFISGEESYNAIVDRVHQTAPSVRCLEAVEAEYLGKLDVYVPKLSHLAMWYPRFDQVSGLS